MVTVQGSLSYRSGLWFVLLVVLLICAQPAAAGYQAGKNDNNDDNGLGLLAKTCAESFCRSGVQGLDLWISLEEVSATFEHRTCRGKLRACKRADAAAECLLFFLML